MTGTVPLGIGKMQQLSWFNLWHNHFVSGSSGLSILTVLTNCSSLEHLDLAFNYFTGVLPTSIGRLSKSLSYLALNSNEIRGSIPDEIGNLTNLTLLDLNASQLNGTIPSALSRLPNLERLYLHTNNLQGRIPESFCHSKKLGLLSLSENMLSGQIPESLGKLPQLRDLILHHNQLSGKIPASLGRCQTLETVDLANNKLSGNLPPEVAGLQNLQFYFNISKNLLQGGIPSTLASCKELEYLNLSLNAFEGPIPPLLADLQNLQYMDLSCNNLSGMIPVAFKKMKMLQHLNLSSNMLAGEVPKGGAFATLDASEVMGNLGLCGGWINLPPCSHSKHNQPSVSKKVIIPIVVGIVILIISLLLEAFSYRYRSLSTPSLKVWPPKFSYEELVDATGGFNDENLLGISNFGSVYKGILKNCRNIAVKVFKLQDEHAHQNFSRECNALKRVRYRNVIKIISTCTNLDFKALILPFVSNGNLERWLYPPEGSGCRLNLSDRIRIAMEIVEGMAYLHHYCFVQVIHCDLKPNNVLFGDDMTASIADFGLSNLIFSNSVNFLTSTNALRGSIGCIAPEYGIGGNLTTKGDVYSYGILVLELLTRKRPVDDMFNEGINLQKWIEMHFPNRISDVVDNCLLTDVDESKKSMKNEKKEQP
ncbi:hypothetical protein SUGI_0380200 [Cryptomeria japonica]|nr:hypothetical protein SUGI_0380200 [Cryptomeria japonica]